MKKLLSLVRRLSSVVLILILCALLFALCASPAPAATATLTWDAPALNVDGLPCTDLAGYNVYLETSSNVYSKISSTTGQTYTDPVTVPNNTVVTRCYFVTAFDTSMNESAYSATLDTVAPKAPGNVRIQ